MREYMQGHIISDYWKKHPWSYTCLELGKYIEKDIICMLIVRLLISHHCYHKVLLVSCEHASNTFLQILPSNICIALVYIYSVRVFELLDEALYMFLQYSV